MTTKAQIARLAARIDDLARRSDTRPEVAFAWQDLDETTTRRSPGTTKSAPRLAGRSRSTSSVGLDDGVREPRWQPVSKLPA